MDRLVSEFKKSVGIMDKLRSKSGCPWDREQTVNTLKKYIIEEAYEVVEALESGDQNHIVEELGDLFFQVLFQARIGKEKGKFLLEDVFRALNEKMVRRHPHVFGNLKGKIKNSKQVLLNWSGSKKKEGKKSVLDGVPERMPTLLRAFRLTEMAASVGFDWSNSRQIVAKLNEEIAELKEETSKKNSNNSERIADEIGDVFFTVVNLARFLKIDPDYALRRTANKFKRRFRFIEESLERKGIDIQDAGIRKMENLWIKAKRRKI